MEEWGGINVYIFMWEILCEKKIQNAKFSYIDFKES